MARAYSEDLRERAVKLVEEGETRANIASLLKIGISSINRWVRQKKETGNLKAKKRPFAYKKIDDDLLKEYVSKNPDAFLREIAEEFEVTEQAIFYALARLKITRKKKQLYTKKETI